MCSGNSKTDVFGGIFLGKADVLLGRGERQHGNALCQVDGNEAKIYIGRNGDAKQTKATASVKLF